MRDPKPDEYVDAQGVIKPIFERIWDSRKRKRPLSKLDSLPAVRDELGKLYADVHHERISAKDFMRSAYVLGLTAQFVRMQTKDTAKIIDSADVPADIPATVQPVPPASPAPP